MKKKLHYADTFEWPRYFQSKKENPNDLSEFVKIFHIFGIGMKTHVDFSFFCAMYFFFATLVYVDDGIN